MNKLELLKRVSFGAQVAEEETGQLATYFVETDQWDRIARGDVDIIRGEKGSGKSAIYSLIVTRSDYFFDRDILLVSAEKPRGATVFSNLQSDPPTSEFEFTSLWKLYIVVIIAEKIRDFGIAGKNAEDLIRILEDQGLLSTEMDLAHLFRGVWKYFKNWKNIGLDADIAVDHMTGIPTLGLKIKAETELGDKTSISVDALIRLANKALIHAGRKIWVLLDRLDVAFAEHYQLEKNALRALFRAYRDMDDIENIKLKIFIRTDIWKSITDQGFREASHLTRYVVLNWTEKDLLNLATRRIISNKPIVDAFGFDKEQVLSSADAQSALFYTLFPNQVDQGSRKPATLAWMISRCADGTTNTTPREFIHLLTAIKDKEISRLERGERQAPDRQLFDRSAFRPALAEVSEARLIQTIYAEYADLQPYIKSFQNGKTEHTIETLCALWGIERSKALFTADRLISAGFFEKRGLRDAETYWVPFLYRPALQMSQGKADEDE